MITNDIEYDEHNNKSLNSGIERIIGSLGADSQTIQQIIKDDGEDYAIKVKIWDSTGGERFRNLVISLIQNSTQGFILLYDITDRSTFEDLDKWISLIKNYKDISQFPIVIVGNKIDLEDKRKVSTEEGRKFALSHNLLFLETSALTGKGLKEAFSILINKVYEKNKTT